VVREPSTPESTTHWKASDKWATEEFGFGKYVRSDRTLPCSL
jgi:hypothetical protein